MTDYISVHHVGSKRGGWNVQWYLETSRRDTEKTPALISVSRAKELGFATYEWQGDEYLARLGPFGTREEAEDKAREIGLEPVTVQKLAVLRKKAEAIK